MTAGPVQKSGLRPMAGDAALAADRSSLRLADVAVGASEFPEHPNPHLKLALILQARAVEVGYMAANGQVLHRQVRPGTASVMPSDMPYRTRWPEAGRMLLMSFSPEFLAARDEAIGRAAGELRPAWGAPDAFLGQLGLSVLAVHRAGRASAAYLDAAAEVAMTHLLLNHGAQHAADHAGRTRAAPPLAGAGLSAVVDYIEAHLGDDLPLARLAAAAGMRTFGFARAFKAAIGEPPHRHVLRRRCERAQHLLARTAMPIADIAYALGFSSQAHFTTAFCRHVGATPGRWRRERAR